jgi:hypothetical protein
LTVSSEMNSFCAIYRLRFPLATSRSTCVSRSVGGSSPRCSASWDAILGGMRFFPHEPGESHPVALTGHAPEQMALGACFECPLNFNVAFECSEHDYARFRESGRMAIIPSMPLMSSLRSIR